MNYRALVLASAFALGSSAALAGDGHQGIQDRDGVNTSNELNSAQVELLEGRAAVVSPAPYTVDAKPSAEPSYFDISERGND